MRTQRKFLHTPSDTIVITDGRGNESVFDLETFKKVEPKYKLPKGCVGQEYISSEKHILYTGSSQLEGEFPWADGERYIKRTKDLRLIEKTDKEDEAYVDEIASSMDESTPEEDDRFYTISQLVYLMWEHLFDDNVDNTKDINEMKKLIKEREKIRGNWRKAK
jgi:hypothetical protein